MKIASVILLIISIASNGTVRTTSVKMKDIESCLTHLNDRGFEEMKSDKFGSFGVCTYENAYRTVGLGSPIENDPSFRDVKP